MIKFEKRLNNNRAHRTNDAATQYKRLASMGRVSKRIINELSNPIDATNRFINLALQSVDEGSQGRQFLLESKQGIRKTLQLLKKLNAYAKRIEREIRSISERNE